MKPASQCPHHATEACYADSSSSLGGIISLSLKVFSVMMALVAALPPPNALFHGIWAI
jgi:hypothetical protein